MAKQTEAAPKDVEEKPKNETISCSICGKLIPLSNFDLHELRCQREKQQAQKSGTEKATRSDKTKPNKKSKKAAIPKVLEEEDGDDNLDDLLAEFKRKDSECALPGCKKSILTVGQKCRCCTNTYCLGHHIPEVHGCTQAAREHARHDAKAAGNSRQASSKSVVKRAHLQRKLENKLKDLEGKRKTKPNQDDKK